ncbi:AfsR/SARP family transcriptional regulator, partial [Actinomadura logoneensis]
AALREALALWRGPALADAAHLPFASAPSARLEELRRTAAEERAAADLELGRHTDLVPELQALASADPLREPLRALLIRALYASGRQAEALAEYDSLRHALADTLGVDPSPALEGLRLAVLRQDPSLNPALNPARTAPAAPAARNEVAPEPTPASPDEPVAEPSPADASVGNLGAQLTSFIGRDEDLRRVGAMLAEGRFVTLTGPGGAGKTRLSLEAGRRVAALLPSAPTANPLRPGSEPAAHPQVDGVWFVSLASVTDPAEVPSTVLAALGLREVSLVSTKAGWLAAPEGADPLTRLTAALAARRPLIILDNCEHLLDAVARLADRVLAECPGARILATSREPLGVTGEALWPVEPLEQPAPDADAEQAMACPAVRLLADRAAAVSPGFAVTAATVADVVRICRALDGMPLAIELAAARLRALTLTQVADRLDDRFRLLRAGSRTALPRHRTLRAVVEWSWDLLDVRERALWRRLAAFPGGADLDAAEAVCSGGPVPPADVLDVLAALVDKSLVTVVTDGPDGEPRYRMLETIRAYGLERLAEAGELERVRRAHALHYAGFAETAEPHLYRAEQLTWIARLDAEQDNLHAALRWSLDTGDAALTVRFTAALGWYWFLRGRVTEAVDAVAALDALPALPPGQTSARALALGAMAVFDAVPREGVDGTAWLRRADAMVGELPSGERLHPVLRMLIVTMRMYAEGWRENVFDGLTALLDDPDPWVRGLSRFVAGHVELNFGRTGPGERYFAGAAAAFREAGDRWGLSFTLTGQAELLGRRGEHRAAVGLYEEAVRLNARLGGGPMVVLQTEMQLAVQLMLLGEDGRAERILASALREVERIGASEGMAALYHASAMIVRRRGDLAEAVRLLDRADALAVGHGGWPQFRSLVLTSRALCDLAADDPDAARGRLSAALAGAVQAPDFPIVATALGGLAALAEHEDDPVRAAELLGQADGLRGGPDLSQPEIVALAGRLRARLGDACYEAAFARGGSRTFDDLLAAYDLPEPRALFADRAGDGDRRRG